MQFYQHSGRCGTWGVPLASGAGVLTGLVLGLVYVYVINWIPIVYVSCLATAAFGFAIGAAVVFGAKVGKMRNMTIAKLVAALVGVLAVYFAWAFDPMARIDVIDRPIWDLETLWEYMKLGYQQGFWSIGRNGAPVTGVFVAAVWVAEAALIIGIATRTVPALLGEQPFCEETNQWTKSENNVARLSLVDDEDAESKLKRLLDGDLTALGQFYRALQEEPAMLQLDLATCPDCPTCNYLTTRLIRYEANKKGEMTKQESKLQVNLQVSPDDVARIRTAGIDRPPEPPQLPDTQTQESA